MSKIIFSLFIAWVTVVLVIIIFIAVYPQVSGTINTVCLPNQDNTCPALYTCGGKKFIQECEFNPYQWLVEFKKNIFKNKLTTSSVSSISSIKQNVTSQNSSCEYLDLEKAENKKIANIICIKNSQKTKAFEIKDMYLDHYHGYELNNTNLYVIRRIGYSGYSDETWTDELWVYQPNLQSRKIIADKGLDFRVSPDGNQIVVTTNNYLKILNFLGDTLKSFRSEELIIHSNTNPIIDFYTWEENSIWVANNFGPTLGGLIKLDTNTFEVTKYDLNSLGIGSESDLNSYNEKIVYSNYPSFFDVDSAEQYSKSGKKVNLIVYDLNTKKQQIIATSITKPFNPKWDEGNTLEYDNPNGGGRLTKVID